MLTRCMLCILYTLSTIFNLQYTGESVLLSFPRSSFFIRIQARALANTRHYWFKFLRVHQWFSFVLFVFLRFCGWLCPPIFFGGSGRSFSHCFGCFKFVAIVVVSKTFICVGPFLLDVLEVRRYLASERNII